MSCASGLPRGLVALPSDAGLLADVLRERRRLVKDRWCES
jgi:hypothetical protein